MVDFVISSNLTSLNAYPGNLSACRLSPLPQRMTAVVVERSRSRAARSMLAGRPQEAVGNGSPRWMAAVCASGAQNPAYRPPHPLP
jgi:hypothetical protein